MPATFVSFTLRSGGETFVNLDAISDFSAAGTGTTIHLLTSGSGGLQATIWVQEPPDHIAHVLSHLMDDTELIGPQWVYEGRRGEWDGCPNAPDVPGNGAHP